MATYYVSATDGDDSDDGSTAALAFATIGSGEDAADTAGDIVYIAPGTYREAVVHGTSGTAADRLFFIGDPDCEHFPNVQPGVVRVTLSDVNDFATNGTNVYCIRTNGKDYITWKNVYTDGGSGGIDAYNDLNYTYGFHASSESDDFELINCVAQSVYYGYRNIAKMVGCSSVACFYHVQNGKIVDKHIALGGYTAFNAVDLVTNSIGIGMSQNMFYFGDKVYNCFGAGASNGGWSSTGDHLVNLISMGMGTVFAGFNDTITPKMSGSYAIGNQYISRNALTSGIGFGNTYKQWSSDANQPVDNEGTTDGSKLHHQKPVILWHQNNLRMLAEALKPTLLNNALRGVGYSDINSYLPDTDIQGNPRFMGVASESVYATAGGPHIVSQGDIGPWEFSNIQTTGSAASASGQTFKITDEGVMTFPISVSGSTSLTASIGIKHESGAGISVKPKFILKHSERINPISSSVTSWAKGTYQTGSALHIQTVGQTANDNVFETVSVSSSVGINRELELVIYNQQTGSDSITSFSDLEIT